MMMRSIVIAIALMGSAYSQPSTPASAYEMTADAIDCNQKTRKCIATSNARITTGAGDATKVLTARNVTASMQEEGAPSNIDAEGDVFLEAQGGKIQSIRSDRAHYEPDKQTATFDGNVSLRFGSHTFKGDHATADLKQGNFTLKGAKQTPVSGLIYPGALSEKRRRA
ncbi:MAG: LPS export ABC transporter periplasmic protein LptC [Alphaproteobacteria bacterium]